MGAEDNNEDYDLYSLAAVLVMAVMLAALWVGGFVWFVGE